MNDAAQGVVEDVPQDVAQDLAFGARVARALLATPPPPPPPSGCGKAQRHLAQAVGKLFRGCRTKRHNSHRCPPEGASQGTARLRFLLEAGGGGGCWRRSPSYSLNWP